MTHKEWKRVTHLILTDIAAQKLGLPESVRHILTEHTLEPDTWTLLQMPVHYLPFAPSISAHAAAEARHLLGRGRDPRIGYQRLAIALHFMADCACPFHTSLFDLPAQKFHRSYEEYVARNMLRGHTFVDALAGTPSSWIHAEYARDIASGARAIGELAAEELDLIVRRIRSCHGWEHRCDVAAATTDLLVGALRMCETEIYSVTAAVSKGGSPLPEQTGSCALYRSPLGAYPFYRTHVRALLRPIV